MTSIGSPALWAGFIVFVLMMLALDLGVFHKKAHAVSFREAGIWSAVWVALSLLFATGVWRWFGPERGLEFITGYVIEKALSVDNVFVFVVVFSAFGIAPKHQHRVLFWGVLGALAMRAAFILAGGALLQRFHFTIYVFGAILVITGVKLLVRGDVKVEPEKNYLVRLAHRVLPMAPPGDHGSHMLVRAGRGWAATPLLLALVAIEGTDVVFAVDSIPAIFAVTQDPFIVFTSNIFAILGLRSLYFLLAGSVEKFRFLSVGLSLVLIFIGGKMLASGVVKVPIGLSLAVVAGILIISIVASLLAPMARPPAGARAPAGGGK